MKFNKLTPAPASPGAYVGAFRYVFSDGNEDVTNIAVSGPYGSCKSSVMKGVAASEEFGERGFLTISLSHFSEDGYSGEPWKRGTQTDAGPDDERKGAQPGASKTTQDVRGDSLLHEIEGEILNQLVQLSDPEIAPPTRFRKTTTPTVGKKLGLPAPAATSTATYASLSRR